MADIHVPVSNLGFQVALSKFKVAPSAGDIIGDIKSVTGIGFSVETTDATTVSDISGYSRPAPTIKTAKPFTVTVYKNNEGYNKVANQFHGHTTANKEFYCSVTLIYPKAVGVNDNIPDLTYHGFISELSNSDVDSKEVQSFSFIFTPICEPTPFLGIGSVTGVTSSPTTLPKTGGKVTVDITGTGLLDGMLVRGFVNDEPIAGVVGYTTGTSSAQSTELLIPSFETAVTIKVSSNGMMYDEKTCKITATGLGYSTLKEEK